MGLKAVEDLLERIHEAEVLDGVAKPLSKFVSGLIPPGLVKDALSGTWIGHPLHPMLTDVAIGSWTSALSSTPSASRQALRRPTPSSASAY